MAIINSTLVLGYLMSTYGNQTSSAEHDNHKKSDLQKVYSRMLMTNRNAPVYKINYTPRMAEFAIDLKANAHKLENVVLNMGGGSESIESVLNEKKAYSSDEDKVKVDYIGSQSDDVDTSETFTIDVDELAKPQVNEGNPLIKDDTAFKPGSYSFDLDSNAGSYEFQFTVNDGDTNYDVQQKIERLINNSDTGLTAGIKDFGRMAALVITSKQTGLSSTEDCLFKISSGTSYNALKALGIDTVSQPASNSSFRLNGSRHHSLSNSFTINQRFAIDLKEKTEAGKPVTVGFKADTDMIADSVSDLIDSYNSFIAVGRKYADTNGNDSLIKDMASVSTGLKDELGQLGITADDYGLLQIDKTKLDDSISGVDVKDAIHNINKFKAAMHTEAEKSSIDPLRYVKKITVEYKDPTKNHFTAVYASSPYSGLLIDEKL
ncbi:MAG: flagellar capping protein [Lachnospiraceae bacterium]|uniref:Flagellar capping protein n=1 Tax=Candidatus Weimeria bifida TaxID=2599074 RepID=A0A6N7J2T0_9FIRM|nr:flagellar capping protein [Candidatus Weimeria bifida]RRF97373.1 MAG: flagellar capping protein [Lachnospiraceae bacterium]